MGAMQNNPPDRKKRGKQRGSVNNARRLSVFAAAGPAHGADWGGVDPERLQQVVLLITSLGGAVMFGVSKDSGSYSLTLLLDKDKQTLWFNGDAVLADELDAVIGKLQSLN